MGQRVHLPGGGLVQAGADGGGDHADGAVPHAHAPGHHRAGQPTRPPHPPLQQGLRRRLQRGVHGLKPKTYLISVFRLAATGKSA